MTASHHSADATLAELLDTYEPRSAAEDAEMRRIRQLLALDDPWTREIPLHVTASALVVHPPTRRVLLRWHVKQQAWLQVGGHADPGERLPVPVALREGREETGLPDLAPWPDARLVHPLIVSVPASTREPAHEHADLRFVLATATPDAARPEHEAAELRWLTVAEATELTGEDNLRETLTRVDRLFDQYALPPEKG
jgi:8-oxo-dGTP pyrophosphatase MutT (NUDIX family)